MRKMLPILKNIKAGSNLCKREVKMDKVCIKYVPAKRYAEELHSVMLKCFPDFWTPRFAEENYTFPYDVKMYLLTINGQKAGQIGYHPYSFHFCGTLRTTGGICDVGVLPEFRGKGYSRLLLEFICGKIIKKYDPLFIPLYTDKPPVYKKMGFEVYYSLLPEKTASFPGEEKFRFSSPALPMAKLVRKPLEKCTEEELKKLKIRFLYDKGTLFNGKCVRSNEVWDELFRDGDSEWILKEEEYFFFRKGEMLENYSIFGGTCPPLHGGHDGNMVMLKLCRKAKNRQEKLLLEKIGKRELFFPLSDVF